MHVRARIGAGGALAWETLVPEFCLWDCCLPPPTGGGRAAATGAGEEEAHSALVSAARLELAAADGNYYIVPGLSPKAGGHQRAASQV